MGDVTVAKVCVRCGTSLESTELESYSLLHWDPATGNRLVAMFCPAHRPLPAPEWMRREVTP